jgi:hypothetical protein
MQLTKPLKLVDSIFYFAVCTGGEPSVRSFSLRLRQSLQGSSLHCFFNFIPSWLAVCDGWTQGVL